jgi:hypothetical protein
MSIAYFYSPADDGCEPQLATSAHFTPKTHTCYLSTRLRCPLMNFMITDLETRSPMRPAALRSGCPLDLLCPPADSQLRLQHKVLPFLSTFPSWIFSPTKNILPIIRSLIIPHKPNCLHHNSKAEPHPRPAPQHGFAHQVTNLDHLRYAR